MLPKRHRLRSGFTVLWRRGSTVKTPFFIVRSLPAFDKVNRVAVVVSKKVSKSAPVRNRIRRRLFAAAEAAGLHELAEPRRTAIIARHSALTAPMNELVASLSQFCAPPSQQGQPS